MTRRNSRTLTLAFITALLVAAVAASPASAHKLQLNKGATADLAAGTKTGMTVGTKSGALKAECEEERLSAAGVANNVESISFIPSFVGCTAEPISMKEAPFDTAGCTFKVSTTTTASTNTEGGATTTAPFAIECGVGGVMKITAPGCTISIPTQAGLHGLNFDNEGAGETEETKLTFAVDNVKYTTPGGFFCTLGGLKASGTDGYITQEAVVFGVEPGTTKQVGITIK